MSPDSAFNRQRWYVLFAAFVFFEVLLTGFGVVLGTGGKSLGQVMTQRLEGAAQVFQTVCALAVIACVAVARARMTPNVVRDWKDLQRETMVTLAAGEMAILLGIVGLAKLHLPEFLVIAGLVLAVELLWILPTGRRLMRTLE